MTDPGAEFDALLASSVERAAGTPGWTELDLETQKARSSRFRREMERYGRENPLGGRTETGLYALPPSSREAG